MTLEIAETRDIALCRELRRVVFTLEQGVSEADELDDMDDQAVHLLARWDGVPIGSARLFVIENIGKIGRVCVLAQGRGKGIGAELIRASVRVLRGMPGVGKVQLGAQVHALGFYEALGFQAFGAVYDDAGIAHRDMVLALER